MTDHTVGPERPDVEVKDGSLTGVSPFDGAALPPIPLTPLDEMPAIVARAREAQTRWAAVAPIERAKKLRALSGALMARAAELAELMHAEQGKSIAEAYTSDIIPSGDLFSYWARTAPALLAPEARSLHPFNFPKKAGITALRPKGVVGLISPWNYPLNLPLRTLVPALAAGNAVVFKPSEYAPRVGARVGELFEPLGGEGLVSVVQGRGDVGEALIAAGVDHVVFTGSAATGRKVSAACAERLIGCSLELGGKDAALVLADADLDRAADGITWAAFANAGQTCSSVERVYVVESVAAPFIEKVLERTAALKVCDGTADTYDVAPLVRPAGLAHVEAQIAAALEQGATLRAGGQRTGTGTGTVFEPTVLTDVTDEMSIAREETFGPVLPIAVVPDETTAIQRANAAPFALTTSIWTRDLRHGRDLSQRLASGVVSLNNHGFTAVLPHAPWGGPKQTGGGVGNSPYALFALTRPTYLLVDRARRRELWWFPHNAALVQVARAMATLAGAAGGKLGAVLALVKGLFGRWR